MNTPIEGRSVLGTRVDATSYDDAVSRCVEWAQRGETRYVCVSTVHMVMEGYDSREYQRVVNGADLVTPDGVPLVWALRLLGIKNVSRVYGPELTPRLLAAAANSGIPVGFFGGGDAEALRKLEAIARRDFPGLELVYSYSPPFRELTAEEDEDIVRQIAASGARILFVGLGCPKQERWMSAHRGSISTVMLGVGAAFDFVAGVKPQAPRVMQKMGLEWVFRFATEPRRLWKRYLKHNPRFVYLFLLQFLRLRSFELAEANGVGGTEHGRF